MNKNRVTLRPGDLTRELSRAGLKPSDRSACLIWCITNVGDTCKTNMLQASSVYDPLCIAGQTIDTEWVLWRS